MGRFLLRRALEAVPTLIGVAVVIVLLVVADWLSALHEPRTPMVWLPGDRFGTSARVELPGNAPNAFPSRKVAMPSA